MIEDGLHEHLRNDPGVYAVVNARIYPLVAPQQAAKPHITYQRVGTDYNRSLSGPTGMDRGTFQVDCWATTQRAARQLADLVRLAIDNNRGTMGNHNVQVCKVTNLIDNWQFVAEGGESIIGRVTMTLDIVYAEQVPT